jgi:hypothetical protein
MTVSRHCACDLPLCPHPRFSPDDPVCKNWPETVDIFCNECRQRRPAVLIEMERAKADSK